MQSSVLKSTLFLFIAVLFLAGCGQVEETSSTAVAALNDDLIVPTQPSGPTPTTRTEDVVTANLDDTAVSSTPSPTITATRATENQAEGCTPNSDWPTYTVQAGDTTASLARRVGSDINELAAANCLEDPSLLHVGQALYVPRLPATPPASTPYPGGPANLEAVANLIMHNNVEQRRSLVQLTSYGCTTADGLGGPPKCDPGMAAGTAVSYLPVMGPGEGVPVRPANLNSSLDFLAEYFYAAFRFSNNIWQADYWPVGDYGLLFRLYAPGGDEYVIVHITDAEEIVRLDFHSRPVSEIMALFAGDILLGPYGGGGEITPTPTPDTSQPAPRVNSLEIVTAVARPGPGEEVTVVWEAEGNNAMLCAHYAFNIANECIDVPVAGSHTFTLRSQDPVADHWVDFRLEVRNDYLVTSETARLKVACHNTWFRPGLSEWCPSGKAAAGNATAQSFENGLIIVTDNYAQIFFDDAAPACRGINGLTGITAVTDSLTPPDGRYLPDPKIAPLWLGNLRGATDIQSRLGWATTPPQPFTQEIQCEYTPDGSGDCFATGSDGRLYIPNTITGAPGADGLSITDGTCTWVN